MAQQIASSFRGGPGREKVPAGGGAWRLFTFMAFIFVVFLLSYLGLIFGYKAFIQAQIEKKDLELDDLISQVPKEQQDEYLKFQFQLRNLRSILDNHALASKAFPLVEANTNSQVFYTSLNLNVKEGRVDMRGTAATYDILAQQLAAYQRMADVTEYRIGSLREGEGDRIEFDIFLFFKPSVFKS